MHTGSLCVQDLAVAPAAALVQCMHAWFLLCMQDEAMAGSRILGRAQREVQLDRAPAHDGHLVRPHRTARGGTDGPVRRQGQASSCQVPDEASEVARVVGGDGLGLDLMPVCVWECKCGTCTRMCGRHMHPVKMQASSALTRGT